MGIFNQVVWQRSSHSNRRDERSDYDQDVLKSLLRRLRGFYFSLVGVPCGYERFLKPKS